MAPQTRSQKSLFKLILGAGGIYFSYIVVAIFFQNLYNTTYQSNAQFNADGTPVKHRFTYPDLIVWLTGLCCSIFGFSKSLVTKQRKNPIPVKQSFILGLLFAIGMGAGNFSLLYVSYPTHSLGKNAKYLFVVLIGAFFSRVPLKDNLKLHKSKLFVALIITAGVIIFNVMKSASVDNGDHHAYPQEWIGYILLVVAMVAQAEFSDSQAYNKSAFKPSANHLFTSANFFAFLMCAAFAAFSGSLLPSLKFLFEHPQCLRQLGLVCILQVTGQVSIYYIVSNFKQHIFPLIASTRKIITIVCSIFIFKHTLNIYQWIGVFIVFIGMVIQVRDQIQESKHKSKEIKEQNSNLQTPSPKQQKRD